MIIFFKKIRSTAKIPVRGSKYAAGYDLYLDGEEGTFGYEIDPGEVRKLPTGIAVSIPHGYFGAIYPRSGLATNKHLRLSNCVGVIDEDYRGEIIVPLFNDGAFMKVVSPGERIAQIIFQPYEEAEFKETDELDSTNRGEGGFGSTGVV